MRMKESAKVFSRGERQFLSDRAYRIIRTLKQLLGSFDSNLYGVIFWRDTVNLFKTVANVGAMNLQFFGKISNLQAKRIILLQEVDGFIRNL